MGDGVAALPDARRRRLAGIGRRSTNQALARRDDDKKFPVLLAPIAECAVEVMVSSFCPRKSTSRRNFSTPGFLTPFSGTVTSRAFVSSRGW